MKDRPALLMCWIETFIFIVLGISLIRYDLLYGLLFWAVAAAFFIAGLLIMYINIEYDYERW